jgi:hypothetical protein
MRDATDRPSVVLHGFDGGIVNNPDIALRLAQIILESVIGPERLALCSPLRVQDRDERWAVISSHISSSRDCRIDIRKLDAAIVLLGVENPPEALPKMLTVEKFAAAIVENARDSTELQRQLPFTVSDKGDTWLVRGSGNPDRAAEGPGPFYLEVRKRDARVLDMWFEWILHAPPEVKELMRQSARKPPESQ